MSTEAQQQADALRSQYNQARAIAMRVGGQGIIGRAVGLNLNAAGDTLVPLEMPGPLFATAVLIGNPSVVPATFVATLWTGPGGTGTTILALTRPTALGFYRLANASVYNQITGAMYINVATPEGSAATMDVYVLGSYVPASL